MTRRRFASANIMEQYVDLYFEDCAEKEKRPTLSGLALYLGFTSLGALRKYEGYNSGDFIAVLERARLRIQDELEQIAPARPGAAFLLKNIDKEEWKDRSEQALDVNTNNTPMAHMEALSKLRAQLEIARHEKIANAIEHQPDDDAWMN